MFDRETMFEWLFQEDRSLAGRSFKTVACNILCSLQISLKVIF